MKKVLPSCLVAIAAAASCASATAQSSVTLSGTLDVFAGQLRNAGDATRTRVLNAGGMTTSYFGFSGVEDLGGGLKASFALNSFFRNDTGAIGRFDGDPFFARDAYVALDGHFGTVSLGRGKAPNFLPTIFANPFGDSFTFSPLVLHANINTAAWPYSTTPSDTGWANQIVYGTPSFGGLVANFNYQFGEQTANAVNNKKNIGGNLLYSNKSGLSLVAFYERDQVTNPFQGLITVPVNGVATPANRRDWMVGGSYDFSVVKAYASYGQAKTDISNYEGKTSSLGVSVPVGVGFILFDVARTKVTASPYDGTRTTGSLGYDYFLSKRTDLYAVALQDRVTDLNHGNTFALGIRHRF